jgi:hypothetical protein
MIAALRTKSGTWLVVMTAAAAIELGGACGPWPDRRRNSLSRQRLAATQAEFGGFPIRCRAMNALHKASLPLLISLILLNRLRSCLSVLGGRGDIVHPNFSKENPQQGRFGDFLRSQQIPAVAYVETSARSQADAK